MRARVLDALYSISGRVSGALEVLENDRVPPAVSDDLAVVRDNVGEAIAALVHAEGEKDTKADVARNLGAIMTAADEANRAVTSGGAAMCAHLTDAFTAMQVGLAEALDASTRLKA